MQSVKRAGGNAFGKSPKSAKKRNAAICAAALVTVILIVIAFLLLSGSETAYRSISIAEISGRVMTENNGNSYAAYENMVIGGGYALTTEKESYTRMLLDGDKYMKLEEQSHAVFENLGDPQSHRTVIRLNYGTFTTEITKPLGNNEDYIVNTPNAVLAVRGTFFRVEVSFDTNGDAYTDVYTYGGAVACHRVMPDGTEVDEEVMIDTGYKARIKMDEIITVYVEELIEYEEDHVDPLEMSDVGDGQLVDVYNASAHGHEMFRSTGELWDEIVEREINLDDYVSVYDGKKIAPYVKDEEPAETFVTTPAPETAERVNPPDNTETQQPESSLLSDTTGSEPIIVEASVPPAGTTAAEAFAELLPGTDSAAAPTGNVAAETAVPNPVGTSGTAPTGRPAVTTVPNETTEETEEAEDTEETEESAPTTTISETTTTTAANQSPSAEIVTRPQAFTTSVPPIPVITTASTGPSHVHTLIEETVPASCTENGAVRTRCSVCGTVVSETVIPALGHNTGSVTVAAACEEDGERLDVCKLCGVIVSQTVIPAAGHTETTETVEATCTASGSITVKCSVCGKILSQESIPVTAHIADTTTIAATCEKNGARTEKCRICGAVLSTEVIPAAGHSYEATETKPASCTEEGEEVEICTVCGQVKPDSAAAIPKLPHTEVIESDGGIETVKCSVCGEIISRAVPVNETNFPDESFLNYVSRNFDTDGDGTLSEEERAAVTRIDVVSSGITSLKGIEYFSGLAELSCNYNSGLTELYISDNTALTYLCCDQTQIAELDVSNNTALTDLYCHDTQIASLDVSQNTALIGLGCDNTQITSLNVSQNTALTYLYCDNTQITSLDVSNNTSLKDLRCGSTQITELDVSNNTALTTLHCYNTQIISLNVSNNTALKTLYCYNTQITSLDVSKNIDLSDLGCQRCQLSHLDLSNNPSILLRNLNTSNNKHPITVINGSFDTHTIDGFDPTRVSDVVGAEWDETTGVFSNITEGTTEITYTYDCKGTNENKFKVTFTLVPDQNSTFAPAGVAIDEENFPDEVFRNYVSENFDTDNDGELSQAEIEAVTSIDVGGTYEADGGVTSLKGIECFTGLTELECRFNRGLTELDVSQNTALTNLSCRSTKITSLDVSNNTALTRLDCYNTQITLLDVRRNTALTELSCESTQITSLDVSRNTALRSLNCNGCRLAYVDLSNNPSISSFSASGNKHPVTVTDGSFDTHTIDGFDPTRVSNVIGAEWDEMTGVFSNIAEGTTAITYTYDCNGAGVHNVTFALVPDENSTFAPTSVAIDAENFPDEVFRNYVSENFDTDSDGELSQAETAAVTNIDVGGSLSADGGITSLKGVEYFTGLIELKCHYNSGLTELDVSQNTALATLYCYNTQITSLNVSNNTALTILQCYNTQITELDVSKNTALKYLNCSGNSLTSLDVSDCTALTQLYFEYTQITSLDVSNNTEIWQLCCYGSPIISLDVSYNTKLQSLWCNDTQISDLDISQNVQLSQLYCYNTQISELDVSANIKLRELRCNNTQITELDVSQNTALTILYCYNTQIASLDVSKNTVLKTLKCGNSRLAYVDVSNNPSISSFSSADNKHPITVINGSFDTHTIDGFDPTRVSDIAGAEWDEATGVFSNITEGTTEITYIYDCDGAGRYNVSFSLVPDENSTFAPTSVAIDEENFPDEVFRNYISENFDTDSDGELSQAEIEAVTSINVSSDGITSLKGVEYFTGITYLNCGDNSGLTKLDVSQNTALTRLYCDNTQITELDVSNNTTLTHLYCNDTKISLLDVSQNTALKDLRCGNTQITSLDLRQNTTLTYLWCNDMSITSLDVSNNTSLTDLACYGTQITSLDVSNNTALKTLYCYSTQITSLNVNRNTALTTLDCRVTQITSLDVSKNTALTDLHCNNSHLAYVDVSNNSSLSTFTASGNEYPIPSTALSFDVSTINGFNPNRVSNVVGADFSPESGIFDNFTSDTITYTYDCDGTGGHNVTFSLVRTAEATASLSDEDDNYAVFPPDASDNFTPPGASDADMPVPGGGAFPSGGAELFSLLPPIGFLAIAQNRKRKTGFRFTQKA